MIRSTMAAAFGALALLGACGQTATQESAAPPADYSAAPAPLPVVTDADFIRQVVTSGAFEGQAAALAATNAGAANVKAFARSLASAHAGATAELTTNSASAGHPVPAPTLSAQQSADLEALRAARGAAFDTMYVNQQVAAHQAAVTLFQSYSASAAEGPLKAWAVSTLPTLQTHLANAQALATPVAPTPP